MARVVLVTGVARDVGARFARALAATGACEVLGLDATSPRRDLTGVDLVRADLRSPVVTRLVADRRVDTVVHCGLTDDGAGRAATKEANVIGTMQLMAACQKSERVSRVVLASSAAVYGSGPLDPARFTESMARRSPGGPSFARDCLDAEGYASALDMRRPDVTVTTLRLASVLGADVDSPLGRYLASPVIVRPLGFDPRLQLLHPLDAVEALLAVARDDVPGTFNVGTPDVLTLGQAAAILGRPTVGVPPELPPAVLSLGRRVGLTALGADQLRAVARARVMDTTAFVDATGLRPHYTSRRALEEFAALGRPGLLSVDRVDRVLEAAARVTSHGGRRTHG